MTHITSTKSGRWIKSWAKSQGYRARRNPDGIRSPDDFYHVPLKRWLGSITAHGEGELSITLDGSHRKLRPYLAKLEKIPGLIPQFGWKAEDQPEDGTFINLSSDDWNDALDTILKPLRKPRFVDEA